MNKHFLFFIGVIFCILFQVLSWGQDTLFLLSDEQKVVELISINKSSGLITYKSDGKTTVRAISSLRSFTNHALVPFSENEIGKEPPYIGVNIIEPIAQDPSLKRNIGHGFLYGPFSIGANLLSPLSIVTGVECWRQRLYVQYIYKQHLGVRLPVTFGFNNKYVNVYSATWQMKYEVGLEPVYYIHDGMKSTFYFLLGAFTGQTNSGKVFFNPKLSIQGPDHTFYRIESYVGVQQNFSKNVVVNYELGLNYNNFQVANKEPFNDINRMGVQGRIHLVYRFKQAAMNGD